MRSSGRNARATPISTAPGETSATAMELAARMASEPEAQTRGEIVEELWDLGTPEALEVLRRRFFSEPDPDVKADIVAGLVENQKPDTHELRFGMLSVALAPNQPAEVRLAAIAVATEFEGPRAVALLQNLAADQDEEIREAAKEAIEARQERDER